MSPSPKGRGSPRGPEPHSLPTALHLPLRAWGRPRPPPIWRQPRSGRSFPAAPGRSAQATGIWTRARRAAHRLGRPACGRHCALPCSLARSRGSRRAHAAPKPRFGGPMLRVPRRGSSRLGASGGGGVSAAGPGPRNPTRFCGPCAWASAGNSPWLLAVGLRCGVKGVRGAGRGGLDLGCPDPQVLQPLKRRVRVGAR